MPDFKNKEEYIKWKASKLEQSQKEVALRKTWICPECLSSNENTINKCNCGYVADEHIFPFLNGNITSHELYKIILNEFDLFNRKTAIDLSHYLIKRFPDTEEALKLKKQMDSASEKVVCSKCGTENIYNPEYYQKDKCEKCGEFLHQPIETDKRLQNCPACGNEVSKNAQFCPKCGEPFTVSRASRQRLWSPGIAALLSLLIPGAGQIYKGQVGAGIIWLIITGLFLYGGIVIEAAFPIIIGLILYIACIVDAQKGDPTKEGG